MNICLAEQCERPRRRNGPRSFYCQKHYYYWRRYGNANKTAANSHRCELDDSGIAPTLTGRCRFCGRLLSVLDADIRFWERVIKTEACWLWDGAINSDGYGHFMPDPQSNVRAHRYSYQQLVGPIPEGLTLDHLCRVKRCVNPDHLEAVTNKENLLRGRLSRQKEATQ